MNNDAMHAADVARFDARLTYGEQRQDRHEKQCEASKGEIFARLGKLERLAYIGYGGLGAVAALATFFGWNILKALAR